MIPKPSTVSVMLKRHLSIRIIILTLRNGNLLKTLVDHHCLFEGLLFLSGRCGSFLDLFDLTDSTIKDVVQRDRTLTL